MVYCMPLVTLHCTAQCHLQPPHPSGEVQLIPFQTLPPSLKHIFSPNLTHTVHTQHHTVCLPSCLQSWLKQPLVDVAAIRMRHDIVEAMVEDPELRGRLRDQHLRGERSLVDVRYRDQLEVVENLTGNLNFNVVRFKWLYC